MKNNHRGCEEAGAADELESGSDTFKDILLL